MIKTKQASKTKQLPDDNRLIAALAWGGGIFLLFAPSLMGLLFERDDELVQENCKECLNMWINALILSAVFGVLYFLISPVLPIQLVYLACVICCAWGAFQAYRGQVFTLPIPILRLVK